MSLCSVIVVACNQLAYTRLFLDSLGKTSDSPVEVIVVDNGSSDGTAEFLREYPGIKVLSNSSNAGLPRAWNQGLAAARGEYLAVCNNDIVFSPGWLSPLVRELDSDRALGLVSPTTNIHVGHWAHLFPPEAALLQGRGADPNWESLNSLYGGDFYGFAARFAQRYAHVRLRNASFDCAVLRREAAEAVGPFEEGFALAYMEDVDYTQRLLLHPRHWEVRSVGSAYIHHFGNATVRHHGYGQLLAEARRRFEQKWGGMGDSVYRRYYDGDIGAAELEAIRREWEGRLDFLTRWGREPFNARTPCNRAQ